jgi:hypothetical protein
MEFSADELLGVQHRHFDNNLRQENLQLKLRIRELESKLAHINRITMNETFTDVRPRELNTSVYK